MLDKAVAAVKADREVALAMFNKGEGGCRDRDLYPFCSRIRIHFAQESETARTSLVRFMLRRVSMEGR
jgi:hypothetical protein